MAYIKTDWKDRLVERPRTFTMQQNVDGSVTLNASEGEILEAGTPVNALNMNKIEDGIEEVASSMADMTNYTLERTNKDSEGIFTTITHKRSDGIKILESVLSGGTSPLYTTRTMTYFDLDGTTIISTETYTLSYDVDGVLISEVLA